MAATQKKQGIPFNPLVMKWARERMNIAPEEAARRIQVEPERVIAWERGEQSEFPTVRQARMLADMFGRPFLEFFSKEIPAIKELELAPDFRFHREQPTKNESAAIAEIQRWAEEIRLNTIDLFELLGEKPEKFPEALYCSNNSDVEVSAVFVRRYLNFSIEDQISIKSVERRKFPNTLRHLFERCGVLVLKHSGLKAVRTRGICLYDELLPIIVFGNESPGGTAFTLVHEFAHILLKQSALSSYPRFGNGSERKRIEGWCNRFAAAFLMPADSVAGFMGDFSKGSDHIDDDFLTSIANRYSVSTHSALIRLVNLGYVNPTYYWRVKRPQFLQQESEYQGFGRPQYYGSRYRNANGDLYTGLVLEAWNAGRITNHNAAEFMGIKNLDHLKDIRDRFVSPDG